MDCLFCKLVAGEIPAKIRHENNDYIAFDDISPKASTHVLIIPRAHHQDLEGFVRDTPEESAKMLTFVTDTAEKIGIAGGFRLITNNGSRGGQEVFHIHWHLLAGDTLPGF